MPKTVTHAGENISIRVKRYRIEIPYINHIGYVLSDVEINDYIKSKYLYVGPRFKQLKNKFMKWVMSRVPIRSGKLADTILSTFRVFLSYGSNNKWIMHSTFDIPDDRPRIIHGITQHSFPTEGYANIYRIKEPEVQTAVHLKRITLPRGTKQKGGTGVYVLNDPTSINRYEQAAEKVMSNILIKDAEDFLKGIKITMEYK